MGVNFEQFKCCPWITLVPFLRDKMIHKWSSVYKERKATHAWAKQWSTCAVTKVEQNQQGLLRGGIPCHNNNSEGRNHGNKLFFDHRKPLTSNFVHHLAHMLEDRSKNDLLFCSKMNSAVHWFSHYKRVYSVVHDSNAGIATFLTVTFDFWTALIHRIVGDKNVSIDDAGSVIACIKRKQLHSEYKRLLTQHDLVCLSKFTFDELV